MKGSLCSNVDCDWFGTDHRSQTPCGLRSERPGEPCRYCKRELQVGESACPACWVGVDDLPVGAVEASLAVTNADRTRLAQSNTVAAIVFDEIKKVWPNLHPLLSLRYGIADALWVAGLRLDAPTEMEYGYTSKWGVIPAASKDEAERRAHELLTEIRAGKSSGSMEHHGQIMVRPAACKPGDWTRDRAGRGLSHGIPSA